MFKKVFCAAYLLVLLSCSTGEKISQESTNSSTIEQSFSPSLTIVHAEVVKLDFDSAFKGDSSHPCGIHPCIADIKIDSVLRKGADYNQEINGTILKVNLAYSAGNTSRFFKAITPPLEGIKRGDLIATELLFEPNRLPTVKLYKQINR